MRSHDSKFEEASIVPHHVAALREETVMFKNKGNNYRFDWFFSFSCNFCAYTATDRKYVKSHSRDVHRSDPDDCFTDHWSPKMELDLEELVAEYFKGKASPIAPSPDFPSNRRIVRLSDPNCPVKSK